MSDPFVNTPEDSLLEAELKRLRQENRELRLANTNLRARLALAAAAPATSTNGSDAATRHHHQQQQAQLTTSDEAEAPHSAHSETASAHGTDNLSDAPSQHAPTPRRTRRGAGASAASSSSSAAAAGGGAAATSEATTARVQEAVRKVREELQAEAEKHRKAAEAERAEKAQLRREFELFVSTTCERESAYHLVHADMYRELEEQKGLVRVAQAQLEEQRVQSLEMRKTLEAAIATAAATGVPLQHATVGTSKAASSSTGVAGGTAGKEEAGSQGEDEEEEDATSTAPAKKRQRTAKAAKKAAPTQLLTQKVLRGIDWSGALASAAEPSQADGATGGADTPSAEEASVAESTGPRTLNILAGGAALRKTQRVPQGKRGRPSSTVSELSGGLVARPNAAFARRSAMPTLQVPVAPVFSPSPSSSTAAGGATGSTQPSKPASPSATTTDGAALTALWRLLCHHSEATQGFLPLWQHLHALHGAERYTALAVLVSAVVHLLGPEGAPLPAQVACLPRAFATAHTSIAVVATAIRLLAVQLDSAAHHQQQHHQHIHAEQPPSPRLLLNSLFYRACVAALRRWQQADGSADALERWATAVTHLYGFQPALLRLMQYTNTTTAYQSTRLQPGWVAYTAQAIFSQCATAPSTLPGDTAVGRWCELCDSVGWSTHALPLDRIETAAARCVAMTRAGHGPLTASCAEEALLALRLVVLYKGFDHMETTAKLLEQPGVLPMAITKEVYAELVSLAVRDGVPFRTQDALHHALRLLAEYVMEAAPERCTSAEHFVSVPRRSHLLAALALMRVEAASPSAASLSAAANTDASSTTGSSASLSRQGDGVRAEAGVVGECRRVVVKWLQAQRVALEMVKHSHALAADRVLLLRDTALGRTLMSEVK